MRTATRPLGYVLMTSAVLVYFSRPWSCGTALSKFSPYDRVEYADFDRHGWGTMIAWLLSLLFAAPILTLARRAFVAGEVKVRLFGRADSVGETVMSVLVALAIGAPMHSQVAYLMGLPIRVTASVLITSILWMLIVEVGRTAVVECKKFDADTRRLAVALAVFISVPKSILVAIAFARS